jgi:hypothetical protein
MEKIPKGSSEYYLIEKDYNEVIKNITREANYEKFIGGLPVTLERNDIYTIVSKDLNKNYRYSVTQKVDGIRLLLFANYKKENGMRNITFIDRNNDFYKLNNYTRDDLPTFNGPKTLIDGELVLYDKENNVVNASERYSNIKLFSYMAFDILYGPMSIEYTGPPEYKKLTIGSEVSMAGPIGGKMWPYKKRYDLLYQLLVPNNLNDNRPPLSAAFKECEWFIPEIKPIYFINSLKITDKLYEYNNNKAFFQKSLIKFRKAFYELINTYIRTGQNKGELINVNLDGLIFTPFDTEYVIGGPWKKFLNVQYKWKPVEEQSIDFLIKIEKTDIYKLQVKVGDNLIDFINKRIKQPYEITDKSINGIKTLKVKNGTIGEFTWNVQQRKFELLGIRKDKKSPNGLVTAINVMNAIRYPVDLEIIKKFLIVDKLNSAGIKDLLQYMTKSQLLRCGINNNKIELFNNNFKVNLLEQIQKFKENNANELEIRFGTIESDRFQSNISFNLYKQILDICSILFKKINPEYSVYYDLFKGNVRTRYLYLENLSSSVPLASIEKQNINNINFDFKYIYNIDLRFSLSSEIPSGETITNESADLILEKKRYSYKLGNFTIDCTEIIKINKKNDKIVKEAPKFQIEIEINDRKNSNDEILNNINKLLISIMSIINS